jgi:cysteine desulfurase NifS
LIYLDNNATTQIANEVQQAMIPCLERDYGNPSSIHDMGREAKEAVEKARRQVAKLINARLRSIIFTSGGSEADNMALKGVAFALGDKGKHIITTAAEHPAVMSTCRFLEKLGYRVSYLEVDEDGWLEPARLERALTDDTILVSIIMANNEVGTILPIKELCCITHERGVLFHTDAIQAVGKIKVDVEELDVDLLSLSGHKLHGPKGVGALYTRRGIKLEPVVHGGKQEVGLRAGTENVPAIVGLGKAAELAMQSTRYSVEIAGLRDKLEAEIKRLVPDARLNGHRTERLPNTLNLTLPELRGESIVLAMDQHGVSLSSGSACKSGSPEPTHVLIAMGRSEEEAHCSVRFSLSHQTTEEEIKETAAALAKVLEEKSMVRLMPCR